MAFTEKHKSTLVDDLTLLVGDLCSEWGFCNHLSAHDLVEDGHHLHASEFADAVLRAEGMNPEYEPTWHRRIGRKFTDRYGSSVSPEEFANKSS